MFVGTPVLLIARDVIQLCNRQDIVQAFPARLGRLIVLQPGQRRAHVVTGRRNLPFLFHRVRQAQVILLAGLLVQQAQHVRDGLVHFLRASRDHFLAAIEETPAQQIRGLDTCRQRRRVGGIFIPQQKPQQAVIVPPDIPQRITCERLTRQALIARRHFPGNRLHPGQRSDHAQRR